MFFSFQKSEKVGVVPLWPKIVFDCSETYLCFQKCDYKKIILEDETPIVRYDEFKYLKKGELMIGHYGALFLAGENTFWELLTQAPTPISSNALMNRGWESFSLQRYIQTSARKSTRIDIQYASLAFETQSKIPFNLFNLLDDFGDPYSIEGLELVWNPKTQEAKLANAALLEARGLAFSISSMRSKNPKTVYSSNISYSHDGKSSENLLELEIGEFEKRVLILGAYPLGTSVLAELLSSSKALPSHKI